MKLTVTGGDCPCTISHSVAASDQNTLDVVAAILVGGRFLVEANRFVE